MLSNVEDYLLVAKMGLTNLKIVIQLLKAINFKEVLQIYLYWFFFFWFFTVIQHIHIVLIFRLQLFAMAVKMD